jgi:type I restriction enzyme, R subunit
MIGGNEAHARVLINAQLKDQSSDITNPNVVRYEVPLPDGTIADYALCDRNGRSLAVIEAKRSSINPAEAEAQGRNYARQLSVPLVFLANGTEVRFWGWQRDVFPHPVTTFFGQDDLIRRVARPVRTDEGDSWISTNLASHVEVG